VSTAVSLAHPALRPRALEARLTTLALAGHSFADVVLGGWAFGRPLGEAPVFMLVGGITASPFPLGDGVAPAEGGQAAWWHALEAPDLVDPSRHTLLCPAWPGNGTRWAGLDAAGAALPRLGVADLADLVASWLDGIGCREPLSFVGASLGGLVGVALAVRHPERVRRLVSISAGLRPDGWGTATRHLQRELVRDGLQRGDVETGMMRARQLGMLTYRSRYELDTRFGRLQAGQDRPPVAGYLDHHGKRFAERFPVSTFLMLSEAIDRSALADSPEALRAALGRVTAEVFVVGVPGDLLFPYALQYELYRELQAAGATSSLWKLESDFGHDAFLADQEKLADLLRLAGALRAPEAQAASRLRFQGVGLEPLREIRIGMVGCGVVGRGVLELLAAQREALAERYGVRFEVARIAVRNADKDRGPLATGIPVTTRPMELVADPGIDAIVEVAGGPPPLDELLVASLAAGKPVVTANKTLLARKLADLGVLAQRTKTPLSCEAAAAAALPIIRHLSHRADEVESLLAIVNGTCNYCITRLEQDELGLEEALERARALGLAEADPSADIDGHDAAAKLSILAYRSFGAWIQPDALPVRGIRELLAADCDLAETMGFRIRHIARAARLAGGLDLCVEPLLLPHWHLVASVEEEYNVVYLRYRNAGDLSLFGKGAGGLPTASAVVGDLIDLAQDNSARWPLPVALPLLASPPRRHYLRVTAEPHAGLVRRVESQLRRAGLTVQSRAERPAGERVHLGFLLSPADDASFARAAEPIRRLARVADLCVLGVGE
jgi:homoserine dehydrogenase